MKIIRCMIFLNIILISSVYSQETNTVQEKEYKDIINQMDLIVNDLAQLTQHTINARKSLSTLLIKQKTCTELQDFFDYTHKKILEIKSHEGTKSSTCADLGIATGLDNIVELIRSYCIKEHE